ncbi:hypothetical protein HETIRDRAFT_407507 [Heterobasidion irregulare TC 32-1]|uniref:Uncharacterized protein n=1 Tax=Heterobasidion irregulare (strain TC 32-1) TaxID=747525 RepID=W4KI04_HETIT|nr:uncharacterized protein HETIRDRAFT_407507 [Heterobasidion irregulare TC 32-1]ETW85477.1 hypothetical protein HETIRDRAFT_407507 [Heterobasidion irregulare TC 32-1]
MTSFLENPKPTNNGAMLPLLHALIIELGLLSKFQGNKVAPKVAPKTVPSPFTLPELPRSLRQAKLLLKSHAFINIRDYLNARGDGFAALQKVLHPSRRSLVREIRTQPKKRVPLGWVKQSGLNVLLVSRY